MTRLIVEQPQQHQVCKLLLNVDYFVQTGLLISFKIAPISVLELPNIHHMWKTHNYNYNKVCRAALGFAGSDNY